MGFSKGNKLGGRKKLSSYELLNEEVKDFIHVLVKSGLGYLKIKEQLRNRKNKTNELERNRNRLP